MATPNGFFLATIVISCLLGSNHGFEFFKDLKNTLVVTATPSSKEVLKAGIDNITITWGVNQTGVDSAYKTIKVKLCYAPISQKDRAWRKTEEELEKDKTCQVKIVARPYNAAIKKETFTWTIERDVPTATYFVRAYAHDANDHAKAYGQSTDVHKTTNLFQIQAITGRHLSLDIASVCFSAFSIISLFGFFYNEKRKAKNSQSK
ncbi:high-affinity nitrate transporter 3.1 [Mercurialis annua]|uniref:high-affinity nitrate transporter 3.1 n=1 Tax=Mercurialis annua TaxID=3986 RepID=UPI00215E96C5|nr:high-affinity nitrate transporter 3.1 [Mercurialis annua]